MRSLTKFIVDSILNEEEKKKTTAVYGGGFKPPTKGHFEVVEEALRQNPSIDEFIIYVGAKERDGITQIQSTLIWEVYKRSLPMKVTIKPTKTAPIRAIYDYAKEHPQEEVLWIIGARQDNEEDFKDISSRTKSISKYPNMELRTIVTPGGVSGTAARNALKVSKDKFRDFLPDGLTDSEIQEVFDIVSIKESLNEHASYTDSIDIVEKIAQLTNHMIDKGMNIEPLPTMEFIDGDSENASDFLGKTAYYDPENKHIVLYTEGRHPKDIVRSYAHEMIHHIQNLEGRLGDITTTNTQEDGDLDKLEQEANLRGTMTFRNWTDSITGNKLDESIVGQKIVCDNCGWSWNINDGGDDMFTCHKCGSEDNMPIVEENYKDYQKFGKDIIIQAYGYFDEAYPLDPNRINLSDSIHFVSKLNDISRNKQRIKNVIFKQLMEAYRGTALESFNKKHNFTPEFIRFGGGGDSWDAPTAVFRFSPNFYKYKNATNPKEETEIVGFFSSPVEYASGIEAYDLNNDSIKRAAQQLGPLLNPIFDPSNLDKSPNNNSEVTPELEAILEVVPVTFIPFIETPGFIDNKDDKLVKSHQSKKVWKDIFNELGLECINYLKDPEWEMSNPQLDEKKDPFGLTAYARELALLREDENYKLFLDMDGVVADFDRRFRELAGMAPKEFENKYGKNAFWEFIDEGDNKIKFWVGIEPMKGAKKLISYIAKNFDYEMLTAPSIKKQSRLGKSLWVRNWTNKGLFPSKPKINFKFSNNKQDFAAPNHILIDDKKRTIDQWKAAGGIGILYQSAEQVIKDLEDAQKRI